MENAIKKRYYLLFAEQDLFKTYCLYKIFGSLISRRGRTLIEVCSNKQDASLKLFNAENKRRQRGYTYADFPNPDRYYLRLQTIKDLIDKTNSDKQIKLKLLPQIESHFLNPNQLKLF